MYLSTSSEKIFIHIDLNGQISMRSSIDPDDYVTFFSLLWKLDTIIAIPDEMCLVTPLGRWLIYRIGDMINFKLVFKNSEFDELWGTDHFSVSRHSLLTAQSGLRQTHS